ncbi:ABC transporter permease [Cupriavidus sp. CuC1]|uniref:ABC transporter permease n=1 Tax=Cupriavidus sp. CuC1 TaxID=3373131 RepID=UPI0037D4CD62
MSASNAVTALFALVRADLRLYFSDRRALVTGVAAPIAIAAFFGYLFNPAMQKPSRIPVALSDLDDSSLSQKIVAALRQDPALLLRELPARAADDAVRQGKVQVAVTLPGGFGEAAPGALFGARDKPVLTLRYDPSQALALAVVRGVLTQHVMEAVSQAAMSSGPDAARPLGALRGAMAANPALPGAYRQDVLAMVDSIERVQRAQAARAASGPDAAGLPGMRMGLPFEAREQPASAQGGRPYNSYAHAFAGMGVQFILFMGIESGVGLLLMRRLGLWQRLRAAPVSRGLLLGSRIVSGALTAVILMALIFSAAIAFFGVRIDGSVAGFAGVAVAFALTTASFGLLVAALGRTPAATRGLAIFATLLMVMLGGAWVPAFLFPSWLQSASLALPTRWAVDGLDAMTWRGLPLQAALVPIGMLLAFAALFALLAIWRFDWEEPAGSA